jgi:hypothetical protein
MGNDKPTMRRPFEPLTANQIDLIYAHKIEALDRLRHLADMSDEEYRRLFEQATDWAETERRKLKP